MVRRPTSSCRVKLKLSEKLTWTPRLYDLDEPQRDPNGLIQWLASELAEAEATGQNAWISMGLYNSYLWFRKALNLSSLVGHIPFGQDILRDQSNYINQVVQRYSSTISGLFFGHTHRALPPFIDPFAPRS